MYASRTLPRTALVSFMAMLDFCMVTISSCTFCVLPEAKSVIAWALALSSSLTLFSEFLNVLEKLFCGVTLTCF